MKFSYALSVQKTSFGAITSTDWKRNAALLSNLGYDALELGVREPDGLDTAEAERFLKKKHLKVSAIGTGQMFVDDGLSFTCRKASLRNRAVKRLKRHIDIAAAFAAPVVIGLARGKGPDREDSASEFLKRLEAGVSLLADYAHKKGVCLAIEPINRYETSSLNNAREALALIKKVNYGNVGVLLDTFHMNIEEKDMVAVIKGSGRNIIHVHFADSNRMYPGSGHINFTAIIRALNAAGYKGYVSAEVLPLPDFSVCARKFAEFIRKGRNR